MLWLLNHDPALRPTAQELLRSELLPPPQMEESELHEVLQHTMANVNGKAYRSMVGQLFAQNTTAVMDFAYDMDHDKVGGGGGGTGGLDGWWCCCCCVLTVCTEVHCLDLDNEYL